MIEINPVMPLAWGSRVSYQFRARVRKMSYELLMPPENGADNLMACMAWESGETFSPSILNKAGSGAVGLIQFMPAVARDLGTNSFLLAAMTAEAQLEYVAKYFRPHRGHLETLADVYMAILWPAAVGKPENFILWDEKTRPTTYRQNCGLDISKDGVITKAEAAARVTEKLLKGQRPDIALA